ncbi:hypothetical protein Dimus_008243, partial [Dionaea muscipula]
MADASFSGMMMKPASTTVKLMSSEQLQPEWPPCGRLRREIRRPVGRLAGSEAEPSSEA